MSSSSTVAELKLQRRLLEMQISQTEKKLSKCSSLLQIKKEKKVAKMTLAPLRDAFEGRALIARETAPFVRCNRVPRASAQNTKVLSSLRRKHLQKHLEDSSAHAMQERLRPPAGPANAGAYKRGPLPVTMFPIRYARGELPCVVEHLPCGLGLQWVCPPHQLDLEAYLPVFAEGLCCTAHPFAFIARQGCRELLNAARGHGEWLLPALPEVVLRLRTALLTKHPDVVIAAVQFLRELAVAGAESNDDDGKTTPASAALPLVTSYASAGAMTSPSMQSTPHFGGMEEQKTAFLMPLLGEGDDGVLNGLGIQGVSSPQQHYQAQQAGPQDLQQPVSSSIDGAVATGAPVSDNAGGTVSLDISSRLPSSADGRPGEEIPRATVPGAFDVVPMYAPGMPRKEAEHVFDDSERLQTRTSDKNRRQVGTNGSGVSTGRGMFPIGEALVKYYRQLLGVLNLFITKRRNIGDDMDYEDGKDSFRNIGTVIQETLEVLERTGGANAYINIRYMVPTYQSIVNAG